MLLHIVHRTTYLYEHPAWDSFNEVRLQPIDQDWQQRTSFQITCKPFAAQQRRYLDLYQNCVYVLEVPERHQLLTIETQSTVETFARPTPQPEDPAGLNDPAHAFAVYDFQIGSALAPLSHDLWRAAIDCRPDGVSDLWGDAMAISDWLYATFEYVPGSTHADTTAAEALAQRQGVCQDYAHVMLALCRCLKIPARYVSGYFFNDQFDPSLGGTEASHAWVEVFLPTQGWRGIDPTHGRAVDERYVSVAVGRDYQDIRPLSGAYRGATERAMDVYVRVTQQQPHETAT